MYLLPTDCGVLTSPANGTVTLSKNAEFGSLATFSCTTGYYLTRHTVRMCSEDGVWSGTQPTCQKGLSFYSIQYLVGLALIFLR